MSRWLSTSNWPFAVKFAVPCIMALIVVLTVEFVSVSSMREIRANLNDIVEHKYSASLQLEQSVDRLRAENGELYLVQLKQAANLPQDILEKTGEIEEGLDKTAESLNQFKGQFVDEADAAKIDEAIKNVRQYRKAVSFVGSMLDMDFKATVNFVLPLRGAYEDTISGLSGLSNQFLEKSRRDALQADELARRETQFIYIFSIISLLLTVAIMSPIIYSTARSISSVADATERLADGDSSIDLQKLIRHDELGHIVSALTVFRDNINRVTELKKVSLLYASMNAMLDSLEQGLCSFGPDGICSDITSKAWLGLFKESPVGRHIGDVLALPADEKSSINDLLELIFGNIKTMALSAEELLGMFPKNFHGAQTITEQAETAISFKYRPIFNSVGKPQSVLVIATDHIDEIIAARLNKEREGKVLRALRILSNRNQFIQFIQGLARTCDEPGVAFAKLSMEQVKRDLHTYKGVASTYYLQEVVEALHNVESVVAAAKDDIHAIWSEFVNALEPVKQALTQVQKEASTFLGESFESQGLIRTLPLTQLHHFADAIKNAPTVKTIHEQFLYAIIGEPIHNLLATIEDEIRSLSERYGKKIGLCEFQGENFQVISEIYNPLLDSLIHIARNIVDHAVDDPETRENLGKTMGLNVMILTNRFKVGATDWMRIVFLDDGKGIDVQRLRPKLLSRVGGQQFANASDQEIIQHIFDEDTSTAASITELSGRGIGLNAVKREAEQMGGSVNVESTLQRFTKITIEVPYILSR